MTWVLWKTYFVENNQNTNKNPTLSKTTKAPINLQNQNQNHDFTVKKSFERKTYRESESDNDT